MSGRAHQAFAVLSAEQIDRLLPFGEGRHWRDGDALVEGDKPDPGMFVMPSGYVAVTRRDGLGHVQPVVVDGPGDVHAESIKRVASAVGEGTAVASPLHRCLFAQVASAQAQAIVAASGTAPSTASVGLPA